MTYQFEKRDTDLIFSYQLTDKIVQDFTIERKKSQFALDDKRKTDIEWLLRDVLEDKRSFIQPQYSLSRLSADTGYSRNLLSAFFNQVLGLHFNDYINQLRITYCKQLIENGDAHYLTLEGLAEKCGFYNRNTFTTAFKKFIGITPSFYIRQYSFG